MPALLVSLRPEQWTKNLIVFAALIFGHRLMDPAALGLSVAAFLIFSDRSLLDMAALKPRNRDEFALVHGVGVAKLKEFASPFLKVIAEGSSGTVFVC